ncbi:MAG: methylmalonyl-CoA mutase family protein, partial [Acidimicrobiia bacterium]
EGWMQAQIEESAYLEAKKQSDGRSIIVGVNEFAGGETSSVPLSAVDPGLEEQQKDSLDAWRSHRDLDVCERALRVVTETASSKTNLMPPIKEALSAGCTVGEVSDALRSVFGEYRAGASASG